MAFVPDCAVDVFISYPMEEEGWSDLFQEKLKERLRPLARNVEVYFAKRDWNLGQPSNAMLEKAGSAALFVAILAPASIDAGESSRFFTLEVEAFRRTGSIDGRFCPIPLKPVSGSDLARLVRPDNPSSFWNKSIEFFYREDGVPITLAPGSEPREGAFAKQVEKLAWHLKTRLEEMRARSPGYADRRGPFADMRVALAPSEVDNEREWNEICTLLKADGVNVLPGDAYADDLGDFRPQIAEDLQHADLFVQLLSIAQWDRAKVALAEATRLGKPILQWRSTINQKLLDAMPPEDRELFNGASVLAVGLEEFKRAIRERLKQLNKPAPAPASAAPASKPYIYITADTSDLVIARQLQMAGRKLADTEVMTEEEGERRQDFEEALQLIKRSGKAASVVFLYGDAKPAFLNRWLKEYLRKTRLHDIHPKLAALYLAPPRKDREAEAQIMVPFDELRMIGSADEVKLSDIEGVCAELNGDHDD